MLAEKLSGLRAVVVGFERERVSNMCCSPQQEEMQCVAAAILISQFLCKRLEIKEERNGEEKENQSGEVGQLASFIC